VADLVDGDWPARARKAAVALVAAGKEVEPSLGVRLLSDLRIVLGEADQMPTAAILSALQAITESPWGDMRGKPLDDRGLAHRLRAYGIKSTTIRTGSATAKGYRRKDLVDSWQRYLPATPDKSVTSVTNVTTTLSKETDVTAVTAVTPAGGESGRTCAQCGARDGIMICRWGRDQEQVFLHAECERFWEKQAGPIAGSSV
jgi:hypothetical protein